MIEPLKELEEKLARHKGAPVAAHLIAEARQKAGVSSAVQYSPQELLRLSEALATHGGYIEMLARSLKVKALMAGASVEAKAPA